MNRHTLATAVFLVIMILAVPSCGIAPEPIPRPTPTATPAPAPSPTIPVEPTGWISFDSRQDGYWGIYIVSADGTGRPAPLTAHLNGEYWSAWAPDGTRIAFASYRDSTGPDGNSSIYAINLDGTRLTQLTDNTATDGMPAWSPNGQEIAFASSRDSGNRDIYIVGSAGTGLRRLTDDAAADEWPSWSPDGGQIAFQSLRSGSPQIHLVHLDGTGSAQLTHDTGTYPYLGFVREVAEGGVGVGQVVEGSPADRAGLREGDLLQAVDDVTVSQPEQLRRVIEMHRPGDEVSLIVVRDGRQLSIVATLGTAPQPSMQPAWSPDGRQIAFASLRDGDWDIYVMNANGSDQRLLTNNDDTDAYPAWSPDGQYIAFSSNPSGNLDVYVMRADGSKVTQLTDHPTDEYPPKWAPAQAAPGDQPTFGPPFCARDTDNDGVIDTSTRVFPQDDQAFYVGFPYAHVHEDLRWAVRLAMDNADPLSFSESWGDRVSGFLTVRFPNWTGYAIDVQGIHGAAIGPFPPGTIAVQLLIEDQVVQEIQCQVVGR